MIHRRIKVYARPESIVYVGEVDFKVVASLYGQNKLVVLSSTDEIPIEPDPDNNICRKKVEEEFDPLALYEAVKEMGKPVDTAANMVTGDPDTEEEFDPLSIYENLKNLNA